MPAVEPTHTPTPEEIMEYLDGEGTDAARATIGAHLASCAASQAIAAEQRGISEHVQAWTVTRPPESLLPLAATRGRVLLRQVGTWRRSRVVLAGLTAAAALLVAFTFNARNAGGVGTVTSRAPGPSSGTQRGCDRPAGDGRRRW